MDYETWEKQAFDEAVKHLRSLAMYADDQPFTSDWDEYQNDTTDDLLLVEVSSDGTAYVHGIGGVLPVPNACQPYQE